MLQELLLCLAGHPSPLLLRKEEQEGQLRDNDNNTAKDAERYGVHSALSPPERALLANIAHLSDLHRKIKTHAAVISTSHHSTICRAVAAKITSVQLQRFMSKIVEVEKAILSKDAGYVGGYGIVPLSTLVGEFAPWTRRLEWLWEVVRYMQPVGLETSAAAPQPPLKPACTGPAVIRFLRKEAHTGYSDLEEMALELATAAETVWLRLLATWVLYGKIPGLGSDDFFIRPEPTKNPLTGQFRLPQFSIHHNLVPEFVSPATATSVLFIGQSLNQIRARDQVSTTKHFPVDPAMELLPAHLEHLRTLALPISSSSFSNAIAAIRLSMSQNALSQLLPLPLVVEILHVLHDFLLLRRGEFAVSLISNADRRTQSRVSGQEPFKPVRKAGHLEDVTMKEGDLATVLNQTWSELAAMQTEDDFHDETLEKGRELLRIIAKASTVEGKGTETEFSGFVFPVPTSVTLSLPLTSPLGLFLTPADLSIYSEINSYLLSIRRAEMHLASLWAFLSLRRPSRGPRVNIDTSTGKRKLAERRDRDDQRQRQLRRYWAVASNCRYVLAELGGYIQGEVIQSHSEHFLTWLASLGGDGRLSSKTSSPIASRPGSSREGHQMSKRLFSEQFAVSRSSAAGSTFQKPTLDQTTKQTDPATLARAHRRHLAALRTSSLLDMTGFTRALRDLLKLLDHFVALFARFQIVQQNLDLEFDEGVFDALANHKRDEREILGEMERSGDAIEKQVECLVAEMRDSGGREESERVLDNFRQNLSELDLGSSVYTPWRASNHDGLLMRLAFVGAKTQEKDSEGNDGDEIYYSE